MKKTLLFIFALAASFALRAQEVMPEVWESRMPHQIHYTGTGIEKEFSYSASDKEMTLFENASGKIIWNKKFSQMAPKLRKIDELIPFWESKTVFLFDRKLGKDQIACIDLLTGEALWSTDKYQDISAYNVTYIAEEDCFALSQKKSLVYIKARTGEELWSTEKFRGVVGQYFVDGSEKTITMVNFVPSLLGALFTGFKNQIAKINLNNGEIIWENTYVGRAERKVVSREFLFNLNVSAGKVFLRMNGMQVYDYNTGAKLWSAAFDYTPDKIVGKPRGATSFGVYGAVAEPVIVGDVIYVLDMTSKRSQYVKKYDLHTGQLLWTSKEIKGGARAIPNMVVIDDKVLLQIGGMVEVQYHREFRQGDKIIKETAILFKQIKPFGVQAFSTTDGSMVWESERFKKGITNMITFDENVIVSSGKVLYSLDLQNGKEKYSSPVTKGRVGKAQLILPYQDNTIVVVGQKGVSTFDATSGNLLHSGKYKTSSLSSYVDNILVMKTPKSDIGVFDLNTCKYKKFNARKGASAILSDVGDYVYVYEKRTVTKLATR